MSEQKSILNPEPYEASRHNRAASFDHLCLKRGAVLGELVEPAMPHELTREVRLNAGLGPLPEPRDARSFENPEDALSHGEIVSQAFDLIQGAVQFDPREGAASGESLDGLGPEHHFTADENPLAASNR